MKIGDHLVSPRTGYSHHGLYVGNDKVIHYSGLSDSFDKGSIELTTLADFAQEQELKVIDHLLCVYDEHERVERAYAKIGEESYDS